MLRVLIGLAFAVGLAAPVQAQTNAAECAAIDDDQERLACYDRLFRDSAGNGGDGSQGTAEPVVIQSERLIPARPTGREPATMIISCEDGEIVVSFSFANQLVSNTGDIAPVTLQVDQNATAVRTLAANEENTALTFDPGSETSAFLDTLAGGTNLKVRMTPVRQRSLTVDFRLPEFIEAIEQLRRSCQPA